jgi:hypothetical protein
MVGNRLVTGVRNSVFFGLPDTYLRVKETDPDLPQPSKNGCGTTDPGKEHPTVSPVCAAEAALQIQF